MAASAAHAIETMPTTPTHPLDTACRRVPDACVTHLYLVLPQCEVQHKEKDWWPRYGYTEGILHCNVLRKELCRKELLADLRIVLRKLVALATACEVLKRGGVVHVTTHTRMCSARFWT